MEGFQLIEPNELYNMLQRGLNYSSLSDTNFLLLVDARKKHEYNESHVVTAKKVPKSENGLFMIPYDAELECKQNIVVYDSNTKDLVGATPALECAKLFWDMGSRHEIKILKGGYEEFSALYPFLRTQKILFTPRELDDIKPYPVEVIQGLLYMGDWRQGNAPYIQKDLKIRAHINCCVEEETFFPDPCPQLLQLQVEDDNDADLFSHFKPVCDFIDKYFEEQFAVLVFDGNGISRAATTVIAFVMYHYNWTLAEAYDHVLKCSPKMRPNRGFIAQLSQWEEHVLGEKKTDISDPNY
ncbi:hypothetical protein EGW08_020143 [Elysia chlorotica]|uniref:Tyrosine-protein phosphatase domain-containing protein n=1 Tax=Elysia chlorotica TaxID=188477 RepID=A0A3S0ZD18_ELYCH|nr:hypothetical protein EGW08_020143 [Elysia chlorotica]